MLVAFVQGSISPVWPPTGLGLAVIWLLGARYWPAIAGGTVVVVLLAGPPLPMALGLAAGNTLEALLAAYMLKRWGFRRDIGRLRDVRVFLATALICTA